MLVECLTFTGQLIVGWSLVYLQQDVFSISIFIGPQHELIASSLPFFSVLYVFTFEI
jgi:hypothetical protein